MTRCPGGGMGAAGTCNSAMSRCICALGQACCGSGTVATGTCNAMLSCANVQGTGIVCVMTPP